MKTLILVRHAKSSWDNPNLSDHDRPLLEIGKKRTRLVISRLQNLKVQPDIIISSSAVRALETAKYIAKGLNYPVESIKASNAYYLASEQELINEFFDMPDRFNTVILTGHNPTLTNLANKFLSKPLDNLPTSGVVKICFKSNKWDQIMHAELESQDIITPKNSKSHK
ncbi:MAG: histidine phosphatase family protein [Bacteroidales bacterium]|jgi:phosphohistidine phosphatase